MFDHTNVYGWDLQPNGFRDFEDAKDTFDWENILWESFWKIDGKIYKLTERAGDPWFIKEE